MPIASQKPKRRGGAAHLRNQQSRVRSSSMRKSAFLFVAFALSLAVSLRAQQLRGDYIESRSTDVYVAQCFANGEVGLTGDFALMAWHVDEGAWNGVKLDGLTIAAAVRARATLGDPYGDPFPAQAVLMVDNAANPAQRRALIALAQHEGGRLLRSEERRVGNAC